MKVIVLGNRGFIGSEIYKHMESDSDIDCVGFSSKDIDLRDDSSAVPILIKSIENSVVIFCAGKHRQWSDSPQTMLDNISMINVLLHAAEDSLPKHIIFLSSIETYGIPRDTKISETSSLNPVNRYAIGKITCELLLQSFCERNGVELSILRLPGIYGAHDKETSIVSKIVQSSLSKKMFDLYGDGNDLRDYVYIKDIVRLVTIIAFKEKGTGLINVATGKSISIKSLIKIVSEMFGQCKINKCNSEARHYDATFNIDTFIQKVPDFIFTEIEKGLQEYNKVNWDKTNCE